MLTKSSRLAGSCWTWASCGGELAHRLSSLFPRSQSCTVRLPGTCWYNSSSLHMLATMRASQLPGAMLAALRGSEWKIKEMRCSWPIRLNSCQMFTVNVCLRVASCVVCTCLVWCPLHRHLTWTAPTNYRSTESTAKLYYFIYWRHPCVCVCVCEREVEGKVGRV